MLRVELATQLLRVRTLIVFGALVALPFLAAVTQAGGRDVATSSALNFTETGLSFMDPVLFGLLAAVVGSILGGADRDWGTLRYLYVRPVSRRRLMAGKWWALAICSALMVATFLLASVLVGLVVFGWHPYQRSDAGDLSAVTATWGILRAGGYLTVCLLSIGSIALMLGLLLPRSVEALAASFTFLVGSALLDNVSPLHTLAAVLPVHYWMRWTALFEVGGGADRGLLLGVVVQLATVAAAMIVARAMLSRRDPVA